MVGRFDRLVGGRHAGHRDDQLPPARRVFRGASETLKVTERFSRVDADTLLYKFTIDDPQTFTRPWSGEVPFEKLDELIYEYACHEAQLRPVQRAERRTRAGNGDRRQEDAPQ